MSNRSTRISTVRRKNSGLQSATVSRAADDADRALANIRAWTELLVARGNRLVERAVQERDGVAGGCGAPRPHGSNRPL